MLDGFLKLWPEIKVFRKHVLIIVITTVIMTLHAPLLTQLSSVLINYLSAASGAEMTDPTAAGASSFLEDVFPYPEDVDSAYFLTLFIPLLFLIYGISRFIHFYYFKTMSEQIVASMRKKLATKFLRLNLAYYTNNSSGTGGLMSRVLQDISILQHGINYYWDIFRESLVALVSVIYLVSLSWKLTLATLIFTPLFSFVIRRISKSLRKHGHRSQESMEQLSSTIKEALDGVRVIQSFNLEGYMDKRVAQRVDHYLEQRKRIIAREEFPSPFNEFFASFLVAGFFCYGVFLTTQTTFSIGAFIAFFIGLGYLQKPIKKLQEAFVRSQQTHVAIERIHSILNSPHTVPESPHPKPFPRDWQTIEFRNVSFSYGDEDVLKNINLVVRRGEQIALVGESGSGKSTLVNLLERFFDPTAGEILIDGVSISEIGLQELRSHIALVTQDVFLFKDSIENNILLGNTDRSVEEVRPVAEAANAHRFIETLPDGYRNTVGERGQTLSGGERQRISIARALFKDAPILILDEATSALDSASEAAVQQGLISLMQGRTSFVIAHRLSTVRNADRILVLEKGRIIEQGTHEELLSNQSAYFNFHRLQMSHELKEA